jgi:uncharacterized Zn finger protein
MDEDEMFYCPVCSAQTDHEVVSRGRNPVGRCLDCGDVHPVVPGDRKRLVLVRAIVSDGSQSRIGTIEMDENEVCRVGDAFVASCGDDYTGVEVTSIEVGGARVERAKAKDISTLWTRKVEEVELRVAIHTGGTTTPLRARVPGEQRFSVGEVYTLGGRRFRVSRIKIRDGGVLRNPGQKIEAKRIKRIFGYPA